MSDPCLSCGTDTGPGTATFSVRRRARDRVTGMEGFLCDVCQTEAADEAADRSGAPSNRYVVIDVSDGGPIA